MLEVIDRVKKLACSGGRGACFYAGTGGCVNSVVCGTSDFFTLFFVPVLQNNGINGKQ